MEYKRVKFIITAKAEHVDAPAPQGTISLSCLANKIFHEEFTINKELASNLKEQLQPIFEGQTFFDKSYLQSLTFEDGVADEIEEM